MSMGIKRHLSILLMGTSAPLLAQQVAPPAAQNNGVGDIVVTATRRSENLQNVTTNVAAFDPAKLAAANISNSVDLQQHVPGLVFSTNGSFGQPYIRGIGSDIINPGTDSPVATFQDGAYQARQTASIVDFFDVKQVEVLKGPQGALYGRNASGGALIIDSNTPKDKFGFDATGSYGNFHRFQFKGDLNLPVTDDLAFRIAGIRTKRDGYSYDPYLKTGLDDEDTYGIRASVRARATSNLTITLLGEYIHEDDSRNDADKLVVAPGLPAPVIDNAASFGYTAPTISSDPRIINADYAPHESLKQKRVNLSIDWDLGFADAKAVSSYTDLRSVGDFDLDGTEVNYAVNREKDASREFAQTVQLASKPGGRFHWIVGADYLHEHASQNFDARLFGFLFPAGTPLVGTPPGAPLTGIIWNSHLNTNAWSAYADLQYDLTEHLRLVASGRYSHERKEAVFNRTYIDPFGILLSGLAQQPVGTPVPGIGTVTDADAGLVFFNSLPRASFDKFTPKASLEYRPRPGLLLYASATNGFKSGGFNLQNNGETFRPESVWSYEAGLKSSLLNNSLHANAAGFYYDYKNLQVIRYDGLANDVSNANARIYGFETELTAKPSSRLTFSLEFAYLNAKYTKYLTTDSNRPALGIINIAGNTLPKSPKFTESASLEYDLPLRDLGALSFYADVRMVSDIRFDQFETQALTQDGYAIVNGRITYRVDGGRWDISLFGRNLANKTYVQSAVRVDDFFGTLANYGAPRTYGVEAGVHF